MSARAARQPSRTANARAADAVTAALEAAGLPAETDAARSGVWHVTVERGVVEAVLRDTGESLFLMHELEYAGGDSDVETLRWLLGASDWGSARLGHGAAAGRPRAVLRLRGPRPPLEPQALAWGVGEVLLLADEYDRLAG